MSQKIKFLHICPSCTWIGGNDVFDYYLCNSEPKQIKVRNGNGIKDFCPLTLDLLIKNLTIFSTRDPPSRFYLAYLKFSEWKESQNGL